MGEDENQGYFFFILALQMYIHNLDPVGNNKNETLKFQLFYMSIPVLLTCLIFYMCEKSWLELVTCTCVLMEQKLYIDDSI